MSHITTRLAVYQAHDESMGRRAPRRFVVRQRTPRPDGQQSSSTTTPPRPAAAAATKSKE